MPQVKGKVTKVTVAPKTATIQVQGRATEFAKLYVTVEPDEGEAVAVQKLAKKGNTGQDLVGRLVQVDFKENKLTNEETGEEFTTRTTDSKGFVLLDADGTPSYKPGQKGATSKPTPSKSSGYSSDGARVGMIIKSAVDLATARGTLDMKGLRQSAVDLLALTKEVETDSLIPTEPPKTEPKPSNVLAEDDISPFDDN